MKPITPDFHIDIDANDEVCVTQDTEAFRRGTSNDDNREEKNHTHGDGSFPFSYVILPKWQQ